MKNDFVDFNKMLTILWVSSFCSRVMNFINSDVINEEIKSMKFWYKELYACNKLHNFYLFQKCNNTIFFILISDFKHISGIRLTNISIPKIADIDDMVQLSCSYDIGGNTLNSVKWYKDSKEFFR